LEYNSASRFAHSITPAKESMHAELIILRIIHILTAIMWVGGGIFTSFFLAPALASSPAVLGQVMAGLQRRRVMTIMPIVATLTILSGLRLLWIGSGGFSASYFATGPGRTFAISGLSALIAYVLAFGVARPIGVRGAKIGAALAGSPEPAERERLVVEVDRLRRRAAIITQSAVGFGILAAAGMAIARYV
jgi:uncharacterized membrane protein